MTRTAIYRHFDAAGTLLYVGVSENPIKRDIEHKSQSPWFSDVARTTASWCVSREHALALERVAIRFEKPAFNAQHTGAVDTAGPEFSTYEILARWPSLADLARDMGMPYIAVYRWSTRGNIPQEHHSRLIESARRFGIYLTAAEIIAAAKPRKDSQYRLRSAGVAGGVS